jgi:hypothetical protein
MSHGAVDVTTEFADSSIGVRYAIFHNKGSMVNPATPGNLPGTSITGSGFSNGQLAGDLLQQ